MPERDAADWRVPYFHLPVLALVLGVVAVGGTITLGSWGTFDALLGLWLLPALALHAGSAASPRRPLAPRVAAWALVAAMAVQSGVLMRAEALGAIALLAAGDVALHPARPDAAVPKLPRRALAALALAVAGAAGLALLAYLARPGPLLRVGGAVALATAMAIAAALRPELREPRALFPMLAGYYLAFVVLAAPVLPVGPAIAWWLLCALVLLGAAVGASHVLGGEVPAERERHRQEVRALPDAQLAAAVDEVGRYLQTGEGAEALQDRVARARGKPWGGRDLASWATPEDRERALRRMMEVER